MSLELVGWLIFGWTVGYAMTRWLLIRVLAWFFVALGFIFGSGSPVEPVGESWGNSVAIGVGFLIGATVAGAFKTKDRA